MKSGMKVVEAWAAWFALVLFFVGTSLCAQTSTQEPVKRTVIVSIPDRKLALLEDGAVLKIYSVAVGKKSTPSPTGNFMITVRVTNPTYYHEGKIVEPGPLNPVGTRWIGLDQKGYGIHGTNAPHSIGRAASHGCIRMRKVDLEELFLQVRIGDSVDIRGERDAAVVAIFSQTETAASSGLIAAATGARPLDVPAVDAR